jgi:hypothetical protein
MKGDVVKGRGRVCESVGRLTVLSWAARITPEATASEVEEGEEEGGGTRRCSKRHAYVQPVRRRGSCDFRVARGGERPSGVQLACYEYNKRRNDV